MQPHEQPAEEGSRRFGGGKACQPFAMVILIPIGNARGA
jgi:hypothetical protein